MDLVMDNEVFTWGPEHLAFADHDRDSMWKMFDKGRGGRRGKAVASANSILLAQRLNVIQSDLESIRVDLNQRIDLVKKAIDEALQE